MVHYEYSLSQSRHIRPLRRRCRAQKVVLSVAEPLDGDGVRKGERRIAGSVLGGIIQLLRP